MFHIYGRIKRFDRVARIVSAIRLMRRSTPGGDTDTGSRGSTEVHLIAAAPRKTIRILLYR